MERYSNLIKNIQPNITDFIKKNIQIIFYGNEIHDFIIYKKLQVKFDFFYIPLEIYNQVKANINLKKTIQILELLGPKFISISVKKIGSLEKNTEIGASTDVLGMQLLNNIQKSKNNQMRQKTKYSLKRGFYFSVDVLVENISTLKHIFMSKEDYNKDFELRYLLRSRIESYLNTYSRLLYVRQLSAVENKIQTNLKNVYIKLGLQITNNFKSSEESIIKIECKFYDIYEIAIIKDIPADENGFTIIKNKYLNDPNCDINKFNQNIQILVNKIMIKYNIKIIHDMIIQEIMNLMM